MHSRRARWSIAIVAALLNIAGSPMAWANLLGETRVPEAAAAQPEGESCHGQTQNGHLPATAPDSMPCCDGGSCYCAAPALSMPTLPSTTRLPHLGVSALCDSSTLPANPLDDSLRPPIR